MDWLHARIVFREFERLIGSTHLLGGSSPAQHYVTSLGEGQRTALRERLQSMLPIARRMRSIPLLGHVWAVRGTKDA